MKITVRENYRVVVEPNKLLFPENDPQKRHKRMIEACLNLVKEIERHCDSFTRADYAFDTVDRCSFCGDQWDEDEGLPQCCDEALREATEAEPKP